MWIDLKHLNNKNYDEIKMALVLFFVCLIVFYSSFKYGFAHDDFDGLLLQNGEIYSKEEIKQNRTNTHIFVIRSKSLAEITPQFFERYRGKRIHGPGEIQR